MILKTDEIRPLKLDNPENLLVTLYSGAFDSDGRLILIGRGDNKLNNQVVGIAAAIDPKALYVRIPPRPIAGETLRAAFQDVAIDAKGRIIAVGWLEREGGRDTPWLVELGNHLEPNDSRQPFDEPGLALQLIRLGKRLLLSGQLSGQAFSAEVNGIEDVKRLWQASEDEYTLARVGAAFPDGSAAIVSNASQREKNGTLRLLSEDGSLERSFFSRSCSNPYARSITITPSGAGLTTFECSAEPKIRMLVNG